MSASVNPALQFQEQSTERSPVQPPGTNELFDYFSAIEQRFTARRGSLLLLSTLDWALIETWREARVPLAAVLRGIDRSFDRYEVRAQRAAPGKGRLRKVNGLAWCAQAVMEAAEQIVEASTGLPVNRRRESADSGFEPARVAAFLERNAASIERSLKQGPEQPTEQGPEQGTRLAKGGRFTAVSAASEQSTQDLLRAIAARLRELAAALGNAAAPPLEELDRTLTLLEERLLAALRATCPEAELAALITAADGELGASRARLGAVQSRRVREQMVQKRLLESYGLPRLSLFHMGLGE